MACSLPHNKLPVSAHDWHSALAAFGAGESEPQMIRVDLRVRASDDQYSD